MGKQELGLGRYSASGSGAQVGCVVPTNRGVDEVTMPSKRNSMAPIGTFGDRRNQFGGVVPTNRGVDEATMPSKRKSMTPIGTFGDGLAERPKTADDRTLMVQGGSLRTWSYASPAVERVQITLSTEGRPLEADIELYNGPSNTPCKMRVYVEDGHLRPFSAVIETPRSPNTVAIRNVGQMVFPFAANVVADTPSAPVQYSDGWRKVDAPSADCTASFQTVQGGAIRTYPNNNKQVIDVYTEDGYERPFFCILETPGPGNVVRIINRPHGVPHHRLGCARLFQPGRCLLRPRRLAGRRHWRHWSHVVDWRTARREPACSGLPRLLL